MKKWGFNLVGVFLVLSVVFWVSVLLTDHPSASDGVWAMSQVQNLFSMLKRGMFHHISSSYSNSFIDFDVAMTAILMLEDEDEYDEQLLVTSGFDRESCVSRYELPRYWRGEARKPSPYLVSKLRSYEARHKRCGPHTDSYNQTLVYIYNSTTSMSHSDCKYIVWISSDGLGNKMLSLASTFLYALLTDRVLLVDRGAGDAIPLLFCEPFPETSWFLPLDFPFTPYFSTFDRHSTLRYGYLLRTNSTASRLHPAYMYLYLGSDCDDQDKIFFCDQQQTYLENIPWLILKTNQYIAPSFFFIPSFQQQLHTLFPEKDAVFHLLGRYLFRPTNSVWGLVTRFYEAYLSQADVVAGIQIRLFDEAAPFKDEQILGCTRRENILPQISQLPLINSSTTTVGVMMISLRSNYFERIRDIYWENPTETGEVVGVFQPSHEEYQQTGKPDHDRKALAEIYLLSFTDRDKLVTSGWSTFGYVAQALGGVKPWILYRSQNQTVPDPPCGRGVSLEPCYHTPPHIDCKTGRGGVDMGGVVPQVRQCEDYTWGLKLF